MKKTPMDPIAVGDLTAYLRKTGWQLADTLHNRLMEFHGPHDVVLVVPNRDDYIDTSRRLREAVHLLSQVEDREPSRIVHAILSLDRDILRQRILAGGVGNSILSLEAATKIVNGLRNLVAYAACVEEDPRPYYAKSTRIGSDYAKTCRFGHTFQGSFGFTVEMPLPAYTGLPEVPLPPPFERRLMSRIARGLQAVNRGVVTGNVDVLIDQFPSGFNANMYEVLMATMDDIEGLEIEYSVDWSPEWPVEEDLASLEPIRLPKRSHQYMETAAKQLRKVDESKPRDITGLVVKLQSETPPQQDFEEEEAGGDRVVTLLWDDTSGRTLHVRVTLKPDEYRAACDAHRDGRSIVVTGLLEKPGKFWELMSPSNFRIEG